MGYEIKMLVGKATQERDEIARSDKPYEDGSGFEYAKDKDGNYVKTGRREHYFDVMATVDLCVLGHQRDALNNLIAASFDTAKARASERVYFWYADDGNTRMAEDNYGALPWPVPVRDVLAALRAYGQDYRRVKWATALLAAMVDDSEGLEVLFYGH